MARINKSYKAYKSPLRKLAHFFEQSRDKWKEKCKAAKRQVKGFKNRVRFLEESRERWKKQAKEQGAEVARLKKEQAALEKEVETLKEKVADGVNDPARVAAFQVRAAQHTYSVGHVALCLELILSAATSLRATERVFEIVRAAFAMPLNCPTWSTVRLWLLRVGYYKLTRPKASGSDWVWIVDHSIQLGQEKCLVILGVRLRDLPLPDRCLGHTDVEPLDLFPVKTSNGTVVYQQLAQTIEKTGLPRAIVGDKGSDLHAGIQKFCQAHPATDYIYDIKHQTAGLLKHELAADPSWLKFRGLASQSKSQVQQTALAALAPPQQKSKARYMNVDRLVQWGAKMLVFIDHQPSALAAQFDPVQVEQKLGWVTEFRTELTEWRQLLSDVVTTETFVRKEGLYHGAGKALSRHLPALEIETDRTKRVRQQLLDFVTTQAAKAQPDERLLGSSEVLESVFGKLKRIEQQQAKSGFTGLLLSVAAMVSKTTTDVVQKALETVSTNTMLDWCQKNLEKSVQALRREAFVSDPPTEQKSDQLHYLT